MDALWMRIKENLSDRVSGPRHLARDAPWFKQASMLPHLAAAVLLLPLGAFAADSNDWITVNKDYSSQRYVDLDQINASNVRALKEVCEAQLNEPSWYNSGLLMVGRTIYTATLRATYAIDAATCEVRWRNVIKLAGLPDISTRGPAYLDGAIFRGTAD